MEVNYFGTVGLTKAVLPVMQKQKSGHIITISSLSGKFGFFLRSAYSAAKFAQVGFFESLRLEEEKNNIKVPIGLNVEHIMSYNFQYSINMLQEMSKIYRKFCIKTSLYD